MQPGGGMHEFSERWVHAEEADSARYLDAGTASTQIMRSENPNNINIINAV